MPRRAAMGPIFQVFGADSTTGPLSWLLGCRHTSTGLNWLNVFCYSAVSRKLRCKKEDKVRNERRGGATGTNTDPPSSSRFHQSSTIPPFMHTERFSACPHLVVSASPMFLKQVGKIKSNRCSDGLCFATIQSE